MRATFGPVRVRIPLLGVMLMVAFTAAHATLVSPPRVGVRSFGFANNYVALSSDLSGLFWNPAGLAFLDAFEAGATAEWYRLSDNAEFFDSKTHHDREFVKLNQLGLAGPSGSPGGGLGWGFGYQKPYSLADIQRFQGSYIDGSGLEVSFDKRYRAAGSLNLWSIGVGGQVAQHLALGLTISLLWGKEAVQVDYLRTVDRAVVDSVNDNFSYSANRWYLGYDVRFGVLYAVPRSIRVGMRICVPSYAWFNEDSDEHYPSLDSSAGYKREGLIHSALSGALGVAVPIRSMTITVEGRVRVPYEDHRTESEASRWKAGVGGGLELPLKPLSMAVRAGYSYDEFDPYLYVFKYDQERVQSVDFTARNNRHLFTAGLEYHFHDELSVDASYGYSFWKLETGESLEELQIEHRVAAGFVLRY
jgi:long-subunit fatty acid transport protein